MPIIYGATTILDNMGGVVATTIIPVQHISSHYQLMGKQHITSSDEFDYEAFVAEQRAKLLLNVRDVKNERDSTDSGRLYTSTIQGTLFADEQYALTLLGGRFVVIIEASSGELYLMGTPQFPCICNIDLSLGATAQQYNGNIANITCTSTGGIVPVEYTITDPLLNSTIFWGNADYMKYIDPTTKTRFAFVDKIGNFEPKINGFDSGLTYPVRIIGDSTSQVPNYCRVGSDKMIYNRIKALPIMPYITACYLIRLPNTANNTVPQSTHYFLIDAYPCFFINYNYNNYNDGLWGLTSGGSQYGGARYSVVYGWHLYIIRINTVTGERHIIINGNITDKIVFIGDPSNVEDTINSMDIFYATDWNGQINTVISQAPANLYDLRLFNKLLTDAECTRIWNQYKTRFNL